MNNSKSISVANPLVYEKQLRSFSLFLSGDLQDAQDLYQETLLRSITNSDSFQTGTNYLAWIKTIMKNVFINQYHLRSRRRSLALTHQELINDRLGLGGRPAKADQRIHLEQLQELVNELPDKFRLPLEMLYQGFKYREIAEILEMPIGTVKSRVFEARQTLSDRYRLRFS
ncbi:MAG: RNA polymerase sigma factor [Bacteroidota bacterium]